MTKIRVAAIAVATVTALGVVLGVGWAIYSVTLGNPRVMREVIENPDGERAKKVMLLTLPDGRRLPVNYLRDGGSVYAGADGPWWRDLVGEGLPVTVLIRGETLHGRARAVLDDPDYTERIFARLRPDAIPGFGTLVEIRLDATAPDR